MIPRSHLITLDQVIIGICKTTNSLIVRVVCNVGLTVRARLIAFYSSMQKIDQTRKSAAAQSGSLPVPSSPSSSSRKNEGNGRESGKEAAAAEQRRRRSRDPRDQERARVEGQVRGTHGGRSSQMLVRIVKALHLLL